MAAPQWWVVPHMQPAGKGAVTSFLPVQSVNKPNNSSGGPFSTRADAMAFIQQQQSSSGLSLPNPLKIVGGWLSGVGGQIGSGIEAGIVTSLKDLWDVIIGPVEVLLGFLIFLWVIAIYLKDDLLAVGRIAAMAAAA